jgi:N-acetylglucosaminyldiphosphoundecaprenol N-acetyl-beta-D-mannosaminyltransferase
MPSSSQPSTLIDSAADYHLSVSGSEREPMAESERLRHPLTPDVERVHVLDVPISKVTNQEALAILTDFVRSGEPHLVVTADASAVVAAAQDRDFRAVIQGAALVTPDSTGILWAARRLGQPLPERVSGVDLAERLCELGGKFGWGVFFYGAAPGVAEEAAGVMQARYPGLRIAGTAHGFLNEREQGELEERIRQSRPELLFVAMGIPRQEKWIWSRMSRLGVPVSMGVGGTFDVFAGHVTRAPVWMQRHGLEWLYRLWKNPRKISKVATLPRFVLLVLRRGRQDAGAGEG